MRIRVSRGLWVLMAGTVVGGVFLAMRGERVWELIRPWLPVFGAVGLHELGHLAAAWGSGVAIRGLRLDLFGARMEMGGILSYGQEAFVAAGGPLVNLISCAVVYPFMIRYGGGWLTLFFWASAVLGGINLLPVGTLDGGRILRCAAAWLLGDRVARGILRTTTAVFLGGLWLIAVYGLLRMGQMLTLFAFSLCLLGRVIGGGEGGE